MNFGMSRDIPAATTVGNHYHEKVNSYRGKVLIHADLRWVPIRCADTYEVRSQLRDRSSNPPTT